MEILLASIIEGLFVLIHSANHCSYANTDEQFCISGKHHRCLFFIIQRMVHNPQTWGVTLHSCKSYVVLSAEANIGYQVG